MLSSTELLMVFVIVWIYLEAGTSASIITFGTLAILDRSCKILILIKVNMLFGPILKNESRTIASLSRKFSIIDKHGVNFKSFTEFLIK